MKTKGKVVFSVTDKYKSLDKVSEELKIAYSKLVYKNQEIILGMKAQSNKWTYEKKFNSRNFEYKLNELISELSEVQDIILKYKLIYEDVSITIFLQCEYAQFGFCLSKDSIKLLSLLNIDLKFDVLSFGLVSGS